MGEDLVRLKQRIPLLEFFPEYINPSPLRGTFWRCIVANSLMKESAVAYNALADACWTSLRNFSTSQPKKNEERLAGQSAKLRSG